jgi:hypothetical protein
MHRVERLLGSLDDTGAWKRGTGASTGDRRSVMSTPFPQDPGDPTGPFPEPDVDPDSAPADPDGVPAPDRQPDFDPNPDLPGHR